MSADAAAGRPAKRSNWGTAGSRWWPKPRAWGSGRFAVGVKNCVTSKAPASLAGRRMRHPGDGRKPLQTHDPAWASALEALVDPTTRGDPMSPFRWTCKSTRKLATALKGQGHQVSHA